MVNATAPHKWHQRQTQHRCSNQLLARCAVLLSAACRPRAGCVHQHCCRSRVLHDRTRLTSLRAAAGGNNDGGGSAPGPEHPENGAAPQGNRELQDALADVLNLRVNKVKAADELEAYVETEAQKLKDAAQEAKDELEKMKLLNQQRRDLALSSHMADVNQELSALEDQLAQSRKQMEADEAEFWSWQDSMTSSRNDATFFKGLYKGLDRPKDSQTSSTAKSAQSTAAAAPTQDMQWRGTARTFFYTFLAVCLIGACIADLTGDSPSYPEVGLYVVILVSLTIAYFRTNRS